jgi:hypothetical protein
MDESGIAVLEIQNPFYCSIYVSVPGASEMPAPNHFPDCLLILRLRARQHLSRIGFSKFSA